MSLNMNDPLDRLYLECLPVRPSGKPDTHLGPTHQWALHMEAVEWGAELTVVSDEESAA